MLLGQKSLSTDESDSQKTYWLIQNTYYIKKTDGLTDLNFFFTLLVKSNKFTLLRPIMFVWEYVTVGEPTIIPSWTWCKLCLLSLISLLKSLLLSSAQESLFLPTPHSSFSIHFFQAPIGF